MKMITVFSLLLILTIGNGKLCAQNEEIIHEIVSILEQKYAFNKKECKYIYISIESDNENTKEFYRYQTRKKKLVHARFTNKNKDKNKHSLYITLAVHFKKIDFKFININTYNGTIIFNEETEKHELRYISSGHQDFGEEK